VRARPPAAADVTIMPLKTPFTQDVWQRIVLNKHIVFIVSIGLIITALFILLALVAGTIGVVVLVLILFVICGGVGLRLAYVLRQRDVQAKRLLKQMEEAATAEATAVSVFTQTDDPLTLDHDVGVHEEEGSIELEEELGLDRMKSPDSWQAVDETNETDAGYSDITQSMSPSSEPDVVKADVHAERPVSAEEGTIKKRPSTEKSAAGTEEKPKSTTDADGDHTHDI